MDHGPQYENVDGIWSAVDVLFENPGSTGNIDQKGMAFQNLARFFAMEQGEPVTALRFDWLGVLSLFNRFNRDAYGYANYCALIDSLTGNVGEKDISVNANIYLKEKLAQTPMRICSEHPRRTRIAAAFSLWMATFRPVFYDAYSVKKKTLRHNYFSAELNLWLACMFLTRTGGRVDFGEGTDAEIRKEHVLYDFMYRDISLSSLEMLYAGIFRPAAALR